jgi:hypothetical protein
MVPQPPASLKTERVPLLKGDKNRGAIQPALAISPLYGAGHNRGDRFEPRVQIIPKRCLSYLKEH